MTAQQPSYRTTEWARFHWASRMFADVLNVRARDMGTPAEGRFYPLADFRALAPDPAVTEAIGAASLGGTLAARRSTRTYQATTTPLGVVDAVVNSSFIETDDNSTWRRPTPSAGALLPVELYLVAGTIDGLDAQVAHLIAFPTAAHHGWSLLDRDSDPSEWNRSLLGQIPANTVGVFVLTARVSAATAKYGERGYRFALLEVGHVAQNLTLCLEAAGFGSVCLGGFSDSGVADLLALPSPDEVPIYAIPFGTPDHHADHD